MPRTQRSRPPGRNVQASAHAHGLRRSTYHTHCPADEAVGFIPPGEGEHVMPNIVHIVIT
eukprot:9465946-Alexandrium_andersonii.AAC.1